jgi:hypothetical protein
VLAQAKPHRSEEHFTVDRTLIETWTSQKSFQKRTARTPTQSVSRQQRRDETHQSKTDTEARLCCKGHGQKAKLGYRAAAHRILKKSLIVLRHRYLISELNRRRASHFGAFLQQNVKMRIPAFHIKGVS